MTGTVEIRQKVRRYIRDTIAKSGIDRNGYRCEYQIKPHKGKWDGSYCTFEQLVKELIEMEKADWDIWITCYNSDSRDEPTGDMCMLYQVFDINKVLNGTF